MPKPYKNPRKKRRKAWQHSNTVRSAWYLQMKYNGACHYCSKKLTFKQTTIDHVIPVSKGGETTESNCVPCCRECNQAKRDMDYSAFKGLLVSIQACANI